MGRYLARLADRWKLQDGDGLQAWCGSRVEFLQPGSQYLDLTLARLGTRLRWDGTSVSPITRQNTRTRFRSAGALACEERDPLARTPPQGYDLRQFKMRRAFSR